MNRKSDPTLIGAVLPSSESQIQVSGPTNCFSLRLNQEFLASSKGQDGLDDLKDIKLPVKGCDSITFTKQRHVVYP